MFKSSPIVKKLFYINIAIFLADFLLRINGYSLVGIFALFPPSSGHFSVYQLLTHQFLHAGLFHLLFNMLALVSIAPYVEEDLGSKKFLPFYLISGLGSALLHLSLINSNIPMVGASGAIYGVLMYFSLSNPNEKLYLFLIPLGIKAKYLIPGVLLIEILLAINSVSDGIGHWAHIGGAITGLVLYLLNKVSNK